MSLHVKASFLSHFSIGEGLEMALLEDTPSALLQIAPQCCAHLSGHPMIQVQCSLGLQHARLKLATHPQLSQAPQQWPGVDCFLGGLQQHQVGLCLKAQKQMVEEYAVGSLHPWMEEVVL